MDLPADTDLVYVPARPMGDTPGVELRSLVGSGERVGLAFTSTTTLVNTLGAYQPWIKLPMLTYAAWLRDQGISRVHVDPMYEDDVREWSAAELRAASVQGGM